MDVMIVEDERIVALASARLVESLGHRVYAQVASAEEALETLAAAGPHPLPHLIFLDIHLEGPMDGIEAGARIAERWKLPIAYASAYTDEETRSRAEATGPVAFVAKPISSKAIREVLERVAGTRA